MRPRTAWKTTATLSATLCATRSWPASCRPRTRRRARTRFRRPSRGWTRTRRPRRRSTSRARRIWRPSSTPSCLLCTAEPEACRAACPREVFRERADFPVEAFLVREERPEEEERRQEDPSLRRAARKLKKSINFSPRQARRITKKIHKYLMKESVHLSKIS